MESTRAATSSTTACGARRGCRRGGGAFHFCNGLLRKRNGVGNPRAFVLGRQAAHRRQEKFLQRVTSDLQHPATDRERIGIPAGSAPLRAAPATCRAPRISARRSRRACARAACPRRARGDAIEPDRALRNRPCLLDHLAIERVSARHIDDQHRRAVALGPEALPSARVVMVHSREGSGGSLFELARRRLASRRISGILRLTLIAERRGDRRNTDLAELFSRAGGPCIECRAFATLLGTRSSGFHFPLRKLFLARAGASGARISRPTAAEMGRKLAQPQGFWQRFKARTRT